MRCLFWTVWRAENAGERRSAWHHAPHVSLSWCSARQYGAGCFISARRSDVFVRQPKQLKTDFIRQCLPLMGGSLCWGIGFTSYTAIMGHMGTDAAAANSVAAVVRDLICCMCNGIRQRGGHYGRQMRPGAGRLDWGKAYGIKLKNISYVIGFLSTALVLAVTPFVVRMVILTDEARGYLTGMMVIMAVYMIGRCVNTVTINGCSTAAGTRCLTCTA